MAPGPCSSTRKFECVSARSLEPALACAPHAPYACMAACWRAGAGAGRLHGRRRCCKILEGLSLFCAVLAWAWRMGAPLRPGRLVVWAWALSVRSRPIARALLLSTSNTCLALQWLPLRASRQVLLCIDHFSSLCSVDKHWPWNRQNRTRSYK